MHNILKVVCVTFLAFALLVVGKSHAKVSSQGASSPSSPSESLVGSDSWDDWSWTEGDPQDSPNSRADENLALRTPTMDIQSPLNEALKQTVVSPERGRLIAQVAIKVCLGYYQIDPATYDILVEEVLNDTELQPYLEGSLVDEAKLFDQVASVVIRVTKKHGILRIEKQ